MLDDGAHDLDEMIDARARQRLETQEIADHGQPDDLGADQGGALTSVRDRDAGLRERLGDGLGDLLGGVGLHGLRCRVVGGDPAQEGMKGRSALGVVPGSHRQAHQPRAGGANVVGDDLRDLLAGSHLQVHGSSEEISLGTEIIGNESWINSGRAGDATYRRTGEAICEK